MQSKNALSGVSIAIRNTLASSLQSGPIIDKQSPSEFSIKVANTLEEREAVFQLSYQVYLEKGYVKENSYQWLVQDYDRLSDTVIFIVKDRAGHIAGTATLVFRNSTTLPVEKTFGAVKCTVHPTKMWRWIKWLTVWI